MKRALPRAAGSATGLLKLLLAACLLVPLLLFGFAGWLNWQDAVAQAERDMLRLSEVAREHAGRVFDGQAQVADRVNDLVRGLDPAGVSAQEARIHAALAAIVSRLPEVQSVLLGSLDGRARASAGTYPVPPEADLRGRDYFRAVAGGYDGTYVSSLQVGAVNRQEFFGLARPWTAADGALLGVVDVAVAPGFFRDYYATLLGQHGERDAGRVVTLIRDDGQILVRYPPFPGPPPQAPRDGPFYRAITAHPDQGTYRADSIVDQSPTTRLFAYSRVEGYPLYVVAGLNRAVVVAAWRRTMASHLVFGIPATLALIAVTWTALIRTRREGEALARANQEMDKRRDAEAALMRAQRLEAVGQMTGGVAHDFNNLLTIVLGSAEMLVRRAQDPARVRMLAEQILTAARRGGEVTQQLLAFSRRQHVNPETIDLNARLLAFRVLLERAARDGATLEFDLDPGLHPVRLDPGHFEAAILNLVGNARDAMPSGGRIAIATRNVARPVLREPGEAAPSAAGFVSVAVSDNGTGMEPEIAARAFEPFFTTKELGRGTGLGLSQVYGFAKQAGGDARIASAPGQGTTVELLLPCIEAAKGFAPSAIQPGLPEHAAAGEVVLAVQDDPGVLDTTVEALRDFGYDTLTARDAPAALLRLRAAGRIDLLFADLALPGTDGIALAHEARRLRPGLKVLLTSGYSAAAEADGALAFPLLAKPYDRVQLASRLQAALNG